MAWGQDTGLGLRTASVVSWFVEDRDARGEAGVRPPNTTCEQTDQAGRRAGYLLPRRPQTPTYGAATKDEKDE